MTIAEDGSVTRGGQVVASIGDDGMLAMGESIDETIHFGRGAQRASAVSNVSKTRLFTFSSYFSVHAPTSPAGGAHKAPYNGSTGCSTTSATAPT